MPGSRKLTAVLSYQLARQALRRRARRELSHDCCTSLPFDPTVRARVGARPVRCGRCGGVVAYRDWRRVHDQGLRGCPTDSLFPEETLSLERLLNRHDRTHGADCGVLGCLHPRGLHQQGSGACIVPGCDCTAYLTGWRPSCTRRRQTGPDSTAHPEVVGVAATAAEVDTEDEKLALDEDQRAEERVGPATASQSGTGGTRRPRCSANIEERAEGIGAR